MKKLFFSQTCHKEQSHCAISCLFTLTDPSSGKL